MDTGGETDGVIIDASTAGSTSEVVRSATEGAATGGRTFNHILRTLITSVVV